MSKIIFILPNIYESTNGVSTKYIKFIDFLKLSSHNFILFTTFKNNESYTKILKDQNIKIIKTNGINIPFYKEIKIPILNKNALLDEQIATFPAVSVSLCNPKVKPCSKYLSFIRHTS